MTIERLSCLTVKVTLKNSELSYFGLKYETLKNNDIRTGKLISCILNEIKLTLGTDLFSENLIVEALSDKYSNCILYISYEKENSRTDHRSANGSSAVFSFCSECEKKLVCLAKDINNKFPSLKSSLFFTNSKYYLEIADVKYSSISFLETIAQKNQMHYFNDDILTASAEEYGTCLIRNDAVEVLSGKKSF